MANVSGSKLDQYFSLEKEILKSFGFEPLWTILPLDDAREYYWYLNEKKQTVTFAAEPITRELLNHRSFYEHSFYHNWHLEKWVYRTKYYTMIAVDTQGDGNRVLSIFSNIKEQNEILS